MKMMTVRAVCTMVGCLLIALSSAPAFAQGLDTEPPPPDAAPGTHFYILMIHGRHSPCPNWGDTSCPAHEHYGTFQTDQANYWIDANTNPHIPTNTGATVLFVQWDAWNHGFDSTTCENAGFGCGAGHEEVRHAIDTYCNFANHQSCRIICHSAGCAAFENWLAKSSYGQPGDTRFIGMVIAAGSAAGGSEAAQHLQDVGIDGTFDPAAIDSSLEPGYIRGSQSYDHNAMKGIAIRGIAGTTNPSNSQFLGLTNTQCGIFPNQGQDTGDNPNCQVCFVCNRLFCGNLVECADGAVAVHSSGGHRSPISYQAVGNQLVGSPATGENVLDTFDSHGWWIHDSICVDGSDLCHYVGPYSTWGQNAFNSQFSTYRVYHGQTKDLAIDEYDACHTIHPRLCP